MIVDDRSLAWRTYSLGDAPPPAAPHGPPNGDGTAVTTDQVLREVAKHLQGMYSASQLSGMVADLETARTNRELAPQRMMLEAISTLVAKAGAPPASNDRLVDLLIAELAAMRQELRDVRTAGAKPAEASPSSAARLGEEIKAVMSAAELLGLSRKGGAAAAPPFWTPDAVKSIVEGAAPILDRFATMLETRMLGGARPALPAPGGETAMARGAQPGAPAPLDAAIAEQIAFFLESLRSRDFPTVQWMLENIFVDQQNQPLVTIDPNVNPLAYVMKLKPFAPAIDGLRAEITEFLQWVKQQRAPRPPEGAEA